jgi:small GTP-binding protein
MSSEGITITLLGEANVGKTSWLKLIIEPERKLKTVLPTCGATFSKAAIATMNSHTTLQFWDISGKTSLDPLKGLYIRNSQAFILFYNATDITSLTNLSKYAKQISDNPNTTKYSPPKIILMATKTDLVNHNRQRISNRVVIQTKQKIAKKLKIKPEEITCGESSVIQNSTSINLKGLSEILANNDHEQIEQPSMHDNHSLNNHRSCFLPTLFPLIERTCKTIFKQGKIPLLYSLGFLFVLVSIAISANNILAFYSEKPAYSYHDQPPYFMLALGAAFFLFGVAAIIGARKLNTDSKIIQNNEEIGSIALTRLKHSVINNTH